MPPKRELQGDSLAAERRQAMAAVDAALRLLHTSRVAAIVSKFADRRAALVHMTDAGARVAASQQIALEEANELARLAVEHAAEKRRMRLSVLGGIQPEAETGAPKPTTAPASSAGRGCSAVAAATNGWWLLALPHGCAFNVVQLANRHVVQR